MSGDSYQPLIDCPTVESITLIHVAELEDGATAVPASEGGKRWNLNKNHGGTPNGYSILRPAPGSPIAGAADARWILQETGTSTVLAQYFDALAVDTIVGGDATVALVSRDVPITSSAYRVRVDVSLAGLYGRDGVVNFFIEVNGQIVTGGQVGDADASNHQRAFAMTYRFNPGVGTNTVRFLVRPIAPVNLTINAQSEFSIRHAHMSITVFSA